jgi:RNA polymerase sigma-70 factor (ECF subfamily)
MYTGDRQMNRSGESDEVLVQAAMKGSREAFQFLMERHGNWLRRFLQRFAFDQDTQEDIYIETWTKAYTHIGTFRADKARFTTWLFQIARNLALNELRKQRRQKTESLSRFDPKEEEDYSLEIAADESSDPQKTTLDRIERDRRREALVTALMSLKDTHRRVIHLYKIQEKGYEEIADILGINEGAARTRVHRAMHELRKALDALESVYPELETVK